MKKVLVRRDKKAYKKNVYIIFTPSKDFTAENVLKHFKAIDKNRLDFELVQEPEAETPKIISPLGVAQGKNDVNIILLALQESLKHELLA